MCGIIGIVNKDAVGHASLKDLMYQGMVVGTLRGYHSSGLFQVDQVRNKLFCYKRAVPGFSLVSDPKAVTLLDDAHKCLMTVAHHRAATQGVVSDDNAHPFVVDAGNGNRLIGVHNGNLTNKWDTPETNPLQFKVDSQWALDQLAKDRDKAIKSFIGPYVFVWYDERHPKKLFVARGAGRPMHFAFLGFNRNAMVFASEPEMLWMLLHRNKIPVEQDRIYEIPENHLVEFDVDNLRAYKKINTLTGLTSTAVVYSSASNTTGMYTPTGRGAWTIDKRKDITDIIIRGMVKCGRKVKDVKFSTPEERTAQKKKNTTTNTSANTLVKEVEDIKKERAVEAAVPADPGGSASETPRSFPNASGKPRVRAGQVALAREVNLLGDSVIFDAEMYDAKDEEVYGQCITNDDASYYPAIIKNISPSIYRAINLADYAECKVIGVDKEISDKSLKEDLVLILAPPHRLACADKQKAAMINKILGKEDSSVCQTQAVH